MDDLPELPFERVLSYLSLEDRLKSGGVSRSWRNRFNSFGVNSLGFSERPSGAIEGKRRLVSGAFAQNFISSTRFASFFNAYGQILSNLKHLRLCDLRLNEENRPAFVPTLQSFAQLEELHIIRFDCSISSSGRIIEFEFKLNLPMLKSIHLENLNGIRILTLNAPKLQLVKLLTCDFWLYLVHGESVEKLSTARMFYIEVEKLKNLKYLYCDDYDERILPTFLSGLEQLKEIHLKNPNNVWQLFAQKQRHRRTDLKIFYCGFLLNGPDDPFSSSFSNSSKELYVHFAEHPSRLADEIPFCEYLLYSEIERVELEWQQNVFSRFTDLHTIFVDEVQDTQNFLDFLKGFGNIVELWFSGAQQPGLFDRLPEHSAVQGLVIKCKVADLEFLFRLKNLLRLELHQSIEIEFVRKVLQEFEFLSRFQFDYLDEMFVIEAGLRNQFRVWLQEVWSVLPNLNAAIQFVIEKASQ